MRLAGTAYAKLNLALHVRGRRPDGRHDIETLFVFCEDGDKVEVETGDGLTLSITGPQGNGLSEADNLMVRAALALGKATGTDRGAALSLQKTLPVASGVGGGSADAAATLRLLTELWGVDPAHAAAIAPGLGADVPACLLSEPCVGSGAGDELKRVDVPELSGNPVLLVNPRTALSTAAVFAAWDGVDRGPLGDWRDGRNDLEAPARTIVPQIGLVLSWLAAQPGAAFVRMSGSGATCFALFEDTAARDAAAAAVPREWWHLATRLR